MKSHAQILCTLAAFVLTACSTISPVKLSTSDEVKGYASLGTISSTSPFGGLFKSASYQAAVSGVLDKAAMMGATDVVLDPNSEPVFLAVCETARGVAYKRPAKP